MTITWKLLTGQYTSATIIILLNYTMNSWLSSRQLIIDILCIFPNRSSPPCADISDRPKSDCPKTDIPVCIPKFTMLYLPRFSASIRETKQSGKKHMKTEIFLVGLITLLFASFPAYAQVKAVFAPLNPELERMIEDLTSRSSFFISPYPSPFHPLSKTR